MRTLEVLLPLAFLSARARTAGPGTGPMDEFKVSGAR